MSEANTKKLICVWTRIGRTRQKDQVRPITASRKQHNPRFWPLSKSDFPEHRVFLEHSTVYMFGLYTYTCLNCVSTENSTTRIHTVFSCGVGMEDLERNAAACFPGILAPPPASSGYQNTYFQNSFFYPNLPSNRASQKYLTSYAVCKRERRSSFGLHKAWCFALAPQLVSTAQG